MNPLDKVVKILDGVEYREEDKDSVFEFAKENGVVIIFGASDDLVELRGAIRDEIGAYDGTTFEVDQKGVIPDFEDIDRDDKEALKDYFSRKGQGKKIEAIWCPKKDGKIIASWVYKTDIVHRTFNVMEEDEVYCIGIAFYLEALA